MNIDEIRIYAEVLEQGMDFKDYLLDMGINVPINIVYAKKMRGEFNKDDSIIERIRKVKDIDVLLTAVSEGKEYPLLLIEYSTAVPTDDHKMQRSDVYFWSSVFQVPIMKISPSLKGMGQDFGGGSNISDNIEIALACKNNAILYHVHWDNEYGKDTLDIKENALSCIADSSEIRSALHEIMLSFINSTSFKDYYNTLKNSYLLVNSDIANKYTKNKIKSVIKNSTRFTWVGEKLKIKINRFGHAMDPERGILYFTNMLLGAENTITEIQVNRQGKYDRKGGYASLFDSLSRESILKNYVMKIIEKGNTFTDENAIYIFRTALCIDDSLHLQKLSENNYCISDEDLLGFLTTHPSIAARSIFFLSTELQLTDKNREIICTVKWNSDPIKKFLDSISASKFDITEITPLTNNEAKEDIITFASVELYKKIQCGLLAVSYPGAQGDRCVLTGSGRKVIRTYIDIIAYKDSDNGIKVYLEECKDKFSKSMADVEKLKEFKDNNDKNNGLRQLFSKTIGVDEFSNIYISVAAKASMDIPCFDVDYLFMFDIDNSDKHKTRINYSIAIIDLELANDFAALKNNSGKLKGAIEIEKIFVIKTS